MKFDWSGYRRLREAKEKGILPLIDRALQMKRAPERWKPLGPMGHGVSEPRPRGVQGWSAWLYDRLWALRSLGWRVCSRSSPPRSRQLRGIRSKKFETVYLYRKGIVLGLCPCRSHLPTTFQLDHTRLGPRPTVTKLIHVIRKGTDSVIAVDSEELQRNRAVELLFSDVEPVDHDLKTIRKEIDSQLELCSSRWWLKKAKSEIVDFCGHK